MYTLDSTNHICYCQKVYIECPPNIKSENILFNPLQCNDFFSPKYNARWLYTKVKIL